MPIIRVELSAGRTHDQKARFMKEVTKLATEILKCPRDTVDLVFVEVELRNWAHGGEFYKPSQFHFDGTQGICP
ncbi:4-oxalocrotonate tautomerase [Paraburkholderia guartelaensis]|uniref:4-oxalocrotonate tautomerase n=1 Tax=Paraburkholderia guartelaensis TaxID=2546446 RepID=A0A4R5L6I9_9BURK|nr:4-oxalocrotonate tautomerase [Paraburkholderia guartelaensis]TDG03517.1 4-oxalocrotonate tautomerase [Paraburkholderia guartelaensis]